MAFRINLEHATIPFCGLGVRLLETECLGKVLSLAQRMQVVP